MSAFLVVITFAIVVAVAVVVFVVLKRRRRRNLGPPPPSDQEQLSRAIDAVRERSVSATTEKVRGVVTEVILLQHDGLDVTMRYVAPAPKRSATVTCIANIERMFLSPRGEEGPYRGGGQEPVAVLDHRPEIFFRKESDLDGLGKRLAISDELQTGDADFDAAVYVRSETERPLLDEGPWQVFHLGSLLGRGALPGLAIWAVFVAALLWRVRGRSHGMSYLIQGGVAMLIGLTGAGAVTAHVLNGALDSSETTVRTVTVLRRSSHGNKNKSYHLHLRSWIPGVDEVEVEVSWNIYESFKNPQSNRWNPAEISTRAGYLGYS